MLTQRNFGLLLQIDDLFHDSSKYKDVEITGLTLKELGAGQVLMTLKGCLVLKKTDSVFIEDIYINQVKSGTLFNISVVESSIQFKPSGQLSFNVR